jgi:tRNA(fMet)-specific endonuclease VapC
LNYLLDSNSVIEHLRFGASSNVTRKIAAATPGIVFLCSIVIGELLFGAKKGPAHRKAANLALIENLQRRFVSLPFDDRAAEEYGEIRSFLAAAGTPIGGNDMLIAAIARAQSMTLVTHNTSEFGRVPGLLIEDWQ